MYQTIYSGFEIYEEKKEQTVYIITRLRGQTSAIEKFHYYNFFRHLT